MIAALALAFVFTAGCASETGTTTDAAVDHSTAVDTAVDDLGSTHDAGTDGSTMDAAAMDSAVPRCVPGMTTACACVGGASGAQTCTSEGVYGACVCPDASAPTDAATDASTLDVPVVPLGPRLITPQSISRTTTQRPTFRWVLPEGVTRARVTVARNRALTVNVRTGMATGTSWRPTEPLPFAVWFWRVEGLGDDGSVVWTSPTWEFRAPRRDTAVDSSWGTWRDFNGDGYDDLYISNVDRLFRGGAAGLSLEGTALGTPRVDAENFRWLIFDSRVSDFNGDGISDIALSATGDEIVDPGLPSRALRRIYIYLGRADGVRGEPDAVLRDYESVDTERYGTTAAADFDADGFGDLLVNVWCSGLPSCSPTSSSRILIYRGSSSGLQPPGNASESGEPIAGGGFPTVRRGSDLNADGQVDLPWYSLVGGSSRQSLNSLFPHRNLIPEFPVGMTTFLFDVDVDGDGRADWMMSRGERIEAYGWSGHGISALGWPFVNAPDIPSGLSGPGFSIGGAGDINGDGFGDIVAGAGYAPLISSSVNPRGHGSVYLYLGNSAGLGASAVATWRGRMLSTAGTRDEFALITSGVDFDGDGYDDIAIGAWGSHRVELRYGSPMTREIGARVVNIEPLPDALWAFRFAE